VIFPATQAAPELARVMRERRVSVMVCVPRQLEALGRWATAQIPAGGGQKAESQRHGAEGPATVPEGIERQRSVPGRWWKLRHVHRALGWKMFGFVVGGAALPAPVEALWSRLGYAVVQGYGLTEAAPAITVTHPFKIRRGSVGKQLPGTELCLAPDGEVLVRGPNVSPGYFRDPDATRESFVGGWLHTGDLGRIDQDGNLIYLGRKKELIVTAEGMNVYPEDVEQALLAQSGVEEAAVVGRRVSAPVGEGRDFSGREVEGEEVASRTLVHAVIVPKLGAAISEMEAAVSRANHSLEPHQRIRSYSLWPQSRLPRTLSTHKLQRMAIAAWLNQAEPGGATVLPPQLIDLPRDWRSFLLQLGVSPERLRPEARLSEDLGLSSLDQVEVLTWLETHGYALDAERFSRARTLADVEAAIMALEAASLELSASPPRPPRATEASEAREIAPTVEGAGAVEPAWPRWRLAGLLRSLFRALILFPVLRCYVRLQVEGREKLETVSPPLLLVANHQSMLDVPVVLRGLPAPLRSRLAPAMGARGFMTGAWRRLWREPAEASPDQAGRSSCGGRMKGFSRVVLFLARLLFDGYLLTDDPHEARMALRHAGRLADAGVSTLVFPEGLRTWDGRLKPFRSGAGVMAQRLRLPVVPLLLDGLFEIWPRHQVLPRRGSVRLRIGDPLFPQPGETVTQFVHRLEAFYRAAGCAGGL
jgi:long-chain acyl-CoA synthetase